MCRLFIVAGMITILASCEKDPVQPVPPPVQQPQMEYTDYNNRELKFQDVFELDLNKDGMRDFFFFTLFVGDPVLIRDKKQFFIGSEIQSYILGDTTVNASIYDKNSTIGLQVAPGLEWNNVASVMMVQKIIPENPPPFWEGVWKVADHKFLPVMILNGTNKYFGWIEMTVDLVGEKIILHKAAISKEPNKVVKAGF